MQEHVPELHAVDCRPMTVEECNQIDVAVQPEATQADMPEMLPCEIAEQMRQDQTWLAYDVTVAFQVQGLQLGRMGQDAPETVVIQNVSLLMCIDIQVQLAKILKDIEQVNVICGWGCYKHAEGNWIVSANDMKFTKLDLHFR